jgi:ribonuclease Y
VIKKEKILQAKEKFLQLKAEHEKYVQGKNNAIGKTESRLKQKENSVNQKLEELGKKNKEVQSIRENLNQQLELIKRKDENLEKTRRQQVEQLETIGGLSAEQAIEQLKETVKDEAKAAAMVHVSEIMEEAKLSADQEARKIVIESIQRTATENAIENSVSVFPLESDEIKAGSLDVRGETSELWKP